ncbi:capsule polysaccharide biosynthesis protein [Fusarium solani]|uniref:Capsule polysaccharide biosynthesis protein n=1 Tax=Fusarium solani TaxID=169388 RepID=A0A9P9JQS3_FUSSL|nr:capsule polysaccharide biosynthesis protein [Fusarium solani]KAH7228383.1 capsule polysaccharide biosynthesis protein [Fusarium solani]
MNPSKPNEPAKGSVKFIVGAVQTNFKKELQAYQKYEIWTRVLSWDRKWFYIVSHFVEKGAVKPRSWDIRGSWPTRSTVSKPEDWDKKILAVSMTKLVFKVGRLTVHPAIVLDASGLLPPRPGGWTAGDNERETSSGGSTIEDTAKVNNEQGEGAWDWRRIEAERLKGFKHAQHFAALDSLTETFDGGEDGAIGRF